MCRAAHEPGGPRRCPGCSSPAKARRRQRLSRARRALKAAEASGNRSAIVAAEAKLRTVEQDIAAAKSGSGLTVVERKPAAAKAKTPAMVAAGPVGTAPATGDVTAPVAPEGQDVLSGELVTDAPPATVEDRIRDAVRELSTRPGRDWVSITKVRELLGDDVDHDEVSRTLIAMQRRGDGVHLAPDSNRRGLTQADRDAAVQIGGEPNHFLTIEAPPADEQQVEAAVRDAYRAVLADREPGDAGWVGLSDLRRHLPHDLSRADVDRVLDKMIESPDVTLRGELNRKTLTPQRENDAVLIGGEARHMMKIGDPALERQDRIRAADAGAADASAIAAHLRETATQEQGAAYLADQQLDREALRAVAAELGITRVPARLSNKKLQEQLLTQAIGARNRFAGLREGWQERREPDSMPAAANADPQETTEPPAAGAVDVQAAVGAPADVAPAAERPIPVSAPSSPKISTGPVADRVVAAARSDAEPSAAAAIAAHLRETATTEQGAAYLAEQKLDKDTLRAVASELGITRVPARLSNKKLQEQLLDQAIGARNKFAGLREGWQKPGTAEPAAASPVSGALSTKPLLPNDWGNITKADGINFHDDGQIGTAIKHMGQDARIDVDGEPVANVLGRIATDLVVGRRTAADGIDAYKRVRDRLPENSTARRSLDIALMRIDAPPSNPPDVPAGTPEPLKVLMRDLHSIPLLRRDPKETQKLQEILRENFDDETDDGPIHMGRLATELHWLRGMRHESEGDAGKFDIDRALDRAIAALKAR